MLAAKKIDYSDFLDSVHSKSNPNEPNPNTRISECSESEWPSLIRMELCDKSHIVVEYDEYERKYLIVEESDEYEWRQMIAAR